MPDLISFGRVPNTANTLKKSLEGCQTRSQIHEGYLSQGISVQTIRIPLSRCTLRLRLIRMHRVPKINWKICVPIIRGTNSWRSKKQSITDLSSLKSEYISNCAATKQGIWVSNLLACFTSKDASLVIKISIDNQGSLSTAKNWSINALNKRIDPRNHLVREDAANNLFELAHCFWRSHDQGPDERPH